MEAESIKNKINLSFENKQELFDEKNYLKEIYFRDSSFRKVSKLLILNPALQMYLIALPKK